MVVGLHGGFCLCFFPAGVSVASNEDYALCLLPAGWGNNNSVLGFLSAARLSLCLRVPVNRV